MGAQGAPNQPSPCVVGRLLHVAWRKRSTRRVTSCLSDGSHSRRLSPRLSLRRAKTGPPEPTPAKSLNL